MKRTVYEPTHELFRDAFSKFVETEIVPNFSTWEHDGIVPRSLFAKAGAAGFLGMCAPQEFGGGGEDDFRYNLIIGEVIQHYGVAGAGLALTLHNDICLPYYLGLATDAQKQRWLPGICDGSLITAVAMTEPGIGSDLAAMRTTAQRDGDAYVVNGSKTFITNGINADLVIVAVKTDPSLGAKGMSLLVLERGMEGFTRGRNLDKLGLHSQDTAELFFDDVHVPASNLLGVAGKGFGHLMENLVSERLSIAASGVAGAEAALGWTLDYVKERQVFGQSLGSMQTVKFQLAELQTEIDVARVYIDQCIAAYGMGELTPVDVAKAKWWCTELHNRVVNIGVQLHGGYGYMTEYPIARAFVDARITTIYGGTTQIMKEIIGRSMGL